MVLYINLYSHFLYFVLFFTVLTFINNLQFFSWTLTTILVINIVNIFMCVLTSSINQRYSVDRRLQPLQTSICYRFPSAHFIAIFVRPWVVTLDFRRSCLTVTRSEWWRVKLLHTHDVLFDSGKQYLDSCVDRIFFDFLLLCLSGSPSTSSTSDPKTRMGCYTRRFILLYTLDFGGQRRRN